MIYNDGFNFFTDTNTVNGFKLQDPHSSADRHVYLNSQQCVPLAWGGNPTSASSSSPSPSPRSDSADYTEILSEASLNYISRMLLEEDIDEKVSSYQEESAALRAAEKPFYEILGQEYPPFGSVQYSSGDSGNGYLVDATNGVVGNSWDFDPVQYQTPQIYSGLSSSCITVPNGVESFEEQLPSVSTLPAWHFRRGIEEAAKFLPSDDKLVISLEANRFLLSQGSELVNVKAEEEERDYRVSSVPRGRKNPSWDDLDAKEGRDSKQSAISSEDILRSKMFDSVLLCYEGKRRDMDALRESMRREASKNSPNGQSKGPNGVKARRGRKQPKKEVVDLRTLLIHCAQAVAADDRRSAGELLKKIRQHSSPSGDGTQRLAHCFADGLEARLAGMGSQIYHSLMAKRMIASDSLKAYHLFLAACPFKRISHFVANQTIMNLVEKASRVHIVDFGIYFGFQWPCLIQRLASRPQGPPKLRITGIDVPLPGFRPTERIEETGRRLAEYAKEFQVPFSYHPISSKWETIRAEDLKIDKDEVLIVNCLYRFRNLVDETVVADNPRNTVLNTIRKMKPDAFIHGIVNGSYNAPFFVTRFREALFHYSAMFDMLETNVPREDAQRLLMERDLFGRDALNVIACEGSERVERPETYKQWQVRNLRAGFELIAFKSDIITKARDRVKSGYHKDFVIEEDKRWLLQGWKGRIMYALSIWRPNNAF